MNSLQKEFEEEELKSQQFLSKLKTIKKASKQIKDKNIHSVQRQEWCQQYLKLLKAERLLTSDLETKLLMIEIDSSLPKYCLSATNQQNLHAYTRAKEDLVQQLQNLRRLSLSVRNQLPSISKPAAKSLLPTQFAELASEFKEYLRLMQNKLEEEFREEYQLFDDECEETLDYFEQNTLLLDGFKKQIEQEYLNDKLTLYAASAEDDEVDLLQSYAQALNSLLERYYLEIQVLYPKQRIQLDEQMLYLASSSSLHTMQRLILHYPKVSRTDLQNVVNYIRKQMDINKRIQILKRNWKIEFGELQAKTEKLLSDMQKDKLVKNQKWINYLELKQQQLMVHAELEEKRLEYELRMKAQLESEKLIQEQQEQIDKEKHEEWLKHKDEIAQQSLEYKRQKEQKRQQHLQELQIQQEMQRREQLQNIEQAKPLVQFRQDLEAAKMNEKRKLLVEQQKQRIEEAINKYSIRPQVEPDFNRLIAETETRQIRQQTKYDKADKIPLSNVTGFNVNQLMSDMRYRLQVALNEAGLGGAKYANHLLNQMSRPNI